MNILDLKRKALGWTYRCGGGSSDSDSSGSDYSNEGRNNPPTGTTAGGTQDVGGGWSAGNTSTPETSTPETSTPETSTPETSTPETSTPETSTPGAGLGTVPDLSTPDYSLGGGAKNPDSGLSATPGTSPDPGGALTGGWSSSGSGNGLTGDVGSGYDRFGNVNYGLSNGNLSFDSSGNAGLSVGDTRAPYASFIDARTSVYTPALGRVAFGQLSPAEQEMQARNILDGKPGYYDGANPGFRESFVDALNFGLDKSGLLGRSLRDLGVKPGMSFDESRQYEKNTPGAAEARYARMNDIAGGIANMVVPAPMKVAINVAKATQAGVPFFDALKTGALDLTKSYAVGAINKAVAPELSKALGPGGITALNTYNKAAALLNMGGAGMPTVPSPGGAIVGAVLGPQSGSQTLNASGQPMTDLAGDKVYGGWSSGSVASDRGTGGSVPAAGQEIQTPAPVSAPRIDGRLNFDGAAFGKNLRSNVVSRFSRR